MGTNKYKLENKFLKLKPCFGNHENSACSWHCLGCILSDECREHKAQKVGNENE